MYIIYCPSRVIINDFLISGNYILYSGLIEVEQKFILETAKSCNEIGLPEIKSALVQELGIAASSIDVICEEPSRRRRAVIGSHPTVTVKIKSNNPDQSQRLLNQMKSGTFVNNVNNRLAGIINQFSSANTPVLNIFVYPPDFILQGS